MFYQAPDFETQMDRAEQGVFPLNRSELQPAVDAAAEVETTWWEADQIDAFADRQDERIRAVTGTAFNYPRGNHKARLGLSDTYGLGVSPEFGLDTEGVTDHGRALDEYNEDIRRLREVHPELSDLKTADEAELDWLNRAKLLRDEAAKMKRHSRDGFTDSASMAELWAGVKTEIGRAHV